MLNATNGVAQRVTPAQKNGWTLGSVQVLPDGRTIFVGPDGLAYASVLSYQRLTANGSHSATQTTVATVAMQVNDAFDLDGVAVLQQRAVERKANERRAKEARLIEATKAYDAKTHSAKKETRRAKPPRKRRKSQVRVSTASTREGRWVTGLQCRRVIAVDSNGAMTLSTSDHQMDGDLYTFRTPERRAEPNVRAKPALMSRRDFKTVQCQSVDEPRKTTQPTRTAAKPRVKMSAKQLTARKEERKEEKKRAKRKRQLARKRR